MSLLRLSYNPESRSTSPIELPLSKSIAARMLTIEYLANIDGKHTLPDCDDTMDLYRAFSRVTATPNGEKITVDSGSGATSLRLFAAAVAATPSATCEILCSEQLRRRPMAPLIDALRCMGADIRCSGKEGYPPLLIYGHTLEGGIYEIDSSMSSQFASAIMLISPYASSDVTLRLCGDHIVSMPYIEMTANLMRRAGADIDIHGKEIIIRHKPYTTSPARDIETDWSGVSYFYEYCLLSGNNVTLSRLTPASESLQGDSKCSGIFRFLGVETIQNPDGTATLRRNDDALDTLRHSSSMIELDLGAQPDLTPAIAVTLTLSGIKYRIFGIAHLRIKECNRIDALANELQRIGFDVHPGPDFLCYEGRMLPVSEAETVETYGDHRIAMSMSMTAIKRRGITIKNPEVVNKSFPTFWNQIARLGLRRF